MSRTVIVNPVTRIEGHAKVAVDLDDAGRVLAARLQVLEFRGFEQFVRGVQVELLPTLMTRICGTCPHAHHLVAAKTVDRVFSVMPPPAALLQRRLMNFASFIHSHAIHFFLLSGPDFMLPASTAPNKRSVVQLLDAAPDLAKAALRLRSLGQKIVAVVGGRGTHPVTAVAGGMSGSLAGTKDSLRTLATETLQLARQCVDGGKAALARAADRMALYETVAFDLATVSEQGALELYEGPLRLRAPDGKIHKTTDAVGYRSWMIEEAVPHSYAKQVRAKLDDGTLANYRVGPLARINAADHIDTEQAQKELEELRAAYGNPCQLPVVGHQARLVELLHCAEAIARLVDDDRLYDTHVLDPVKTTPKGAITHIEAPRGVLLYDVDVDGAGLVTGANLLVATQHNLTSIDGTLRAAAEKATGVSDPELLDAVEFAIRCYDPCLSCSTHQLGQMPIIVELRREGAVVAELRRDA